MPKPPAGWAERAQGYANGKHCLRCGARRIDAQLGLEATPADFIAEMVAVFRAIRRVLRDDGTCWLNLGDSYASGTTGRNDQDRNTRNKDGRNPAAASLTDAPHYGQHSVPDGHKPKDLLLMPARVALALQADGWWIRSEIVWAKPNPMPESVTDRPTSAHEKVYLLSKRARYFYDADAVREDSVYPAGHMVTLGEKSLSRGQANGAGIAASGNGLAAQVECKGGRNLRNVWEIATHPYSAAHFATFPPTLAERCIRAGTSERGCCAACGAPWLRVTEKGELRPVRGNYIGAMGDDYKRDGSAEVIYKAGRSMVRTDEGWSLLKRDSITTGWRAGCQCNAEVVPCTVLDPFSGAGTTALVADRLGRNAIGIDLSHQYVEMARERLVADCPLFAELSPPPATYDAEDQAMADLFAPLAAD